MHKSWQIILKVLTIKKGIKWNCLKTCSRSYSNVCEFMSCAANLFKTYSGKQELKTFAHTIKWTTLPDRLIICAPIPIYQLSQIVYMKIYVQLFFIKVIWSYISNWYKKNKYDNSLCIHWLRHCWWSVANFRPIRHTFQIFSSCKKLYL